MSTAKKHECQEEGVMTGLVMARKKGFTDLHSISKWTASRSRGSRLKGAKNGLLSPSRAWRPLSKNAIQRTKRLLKMEGSSGCIPRSADSL